MVRTPFSLIGTNRLSICSVRCHLCSIMEVTLSNSISNNSSLISCPAESQVRTQTWASTSTPAMDQAIKTTIAGSNISYHHSSSCLKASSRGYFLALEFKICKQIFNSKYNYHRTWCYLSRVITTLPCLSSFTRLSTHLEISSTLSLILMDTSTCSLSQTITFLNNKSVRFIFHRKTRIIWATSIVYLKL